MACEYHCGWNDAIVIDDSRLSVDGLQSLTRGDLAPAIDVRAMNKALSAPEDIDDLCAWPPRAYRFASAIQLPRYEWCSYEEFLCEYQPDCRDPDGVVEVCFRAQ
jgi:hypothetical protein